MLGGIVADFVYNRDVPLLPESVQQGVRLHRFVDAFTDRHAVVLKSVSRMSAKLGWFTGIVIDIYYDHILARDWSRYSIEPLDTFARRAYRHLGGAYAQTPLEGQPFTPPEAQHFIRRFIDNDVLVDYATTDGITRAFERVSRVIAERIPKKAVWLPDAMPDLLAADADLAADFHTFYPELFAFASEQRRTLIAPPGE